MATTKFTSVSEYIASQPAGARATLRRVRVAIRKAVPAAEEMISYQIPGYKLHGRPLIAFAGWKEHFSIYPANKRLVATFKTELAPYEVRNATIRFPLTMRPPVKLIERIAKFRAKEVVARKSARDGYRRSGTSGGRLGAAPFDSTRRRAK
jgi:uncharacterized protein YdhG (YjbR/CyaY superfamily)